MDRFKKGGDSFNKYKQVDVGDMKEGAMDKANDLKDQAEAQAMEHVNAMKDKLKLGFTDNLGKYRFFTVGCACVSLIAAFANLVIAMSYFREDQSYQVTQYSEDLKMTLTFTVPTTGLP